MQAQKYILTTSNNIRDPGLLKFMCDVSAVSCGGARTSITTCSNFSLPLLSWMRLQASCMFHIWQRFFDFANIACDEKFCRLLSVIYKWVAHISTGWTTGNILPADLSYWLTYCTIKTLTSVRRDSAEEQFSYIFCIAGSWINVWIYYERDISSSGWS